MSGHEERARVDVLVVDDDAAGMAPYEASLGGLNVDVHRARGRENALELLVHRDFGLIVLDMETRERDVLETARRIRWRPRFEHTPLLFLASMAEDKLGGLQEFATGLVDYLVKPFTVERLRSKVGLYAELARKTAQAKWAMEQLREVEGRVQEHELKLSQSAAELRASEDFVAVASHELRAPLTALKLQVRNALHAWARPEVQVVPVDQAHTHLRRMEDSVERMIRLSDDLLDVSRMGTGNLALERAEVDLTALVREVVAAAGAGAEPRRLRAEPRHGGARGGRVGSQAPGSGAVEPARQRHEVRARPITLTLRTGLGVTILQVVDEGPGMATGMRGLMLGGRLERSSWPDSNSHRGLGLWIIDQIIARHGGTFAASHHHGGGAAFTVTLPTALPGPSVDRDLGEKEVAPS